MCVLAVCERRSGLTKWVLNTSKCVTSQITLWDSNTPDIGRVFKLARHREIYEELESLLDSYETRILDSAGINNLKDILISS